MDTVLHRRPTREWHKCCTLRTHQLLQSPIRGEWDKGQSSQVKTCRGVRTLNKWWYQTATCHLNIVRAVAAACEWLCMAWALRELLWFISSATCDGVRTGTSVLPAQTVWQLGWEDQGCLVWSWVSSVNKSGPLDYWRYCSYCCSCRSLKFCFDKESKDQWWIIT